MEQIKTTGRNSLWMEEPDAGKVRFNMLEAGELFRFGYGPDATIFMKTTDWFAVALNSGLLLGNSIGSTQLVYPLPPGSRVIVQNGG